jgi:outer membrane lipoprotein-sorting protein
MVFITSFSITPNEMLKAVDYNMTPTSVSYEGEMNIIRNGKKRTKKFVMDAIGSEKSFIKFSYPKRDSGTKFLRNGANLWIYMPNTAKTIKISDHMLKNSMMGSDFSYDDQTDRNKYHEIYNSTLIEETETEYKLELIRKEGIEAKYQKQIVWIDKKTLTLTKSEMYATSGKLLKEMLVDEIQKLGDRYYITKMRMVDMLKSDSYTELILTNIEIDPTIPDSIFSLRNLERN